MWLNWFGKKPFKMQSPVFRSTGTTGPPMTGKDGYEVCIECGDKTAVRCETPISQRQYYIEGSGQLCEKCYRETYSATSRPAQNKISLIELCAIDAGCREISDLHIISQTQRRSLANKLEKLDARDANLSDWNDALAYLVDAPAEHTAEKAQQRLVENLRR